jgi:hypothetical protein
MKTRILVSLIAGFLCSNASAQTADDWVSQGRSYLAARDITDANASFAKALVLNPNHKNANALYAITRLLVLPSQPAGSNFLTRIGFPAAGRNIYKWNSVPPKDANGLWIAPNGVNANEFTAQLRTNVLSVVSGAVGNLAAITDTNFTISLTSSETAMAGVTVDYGDLKLIQAGLYSSEYLIYTLNAQNLDAQLTAIRSLYTNGALSAEQVLSSYPQLFTFATTNDLQAARAAFTNAVNCYMSASAFIRNRPPGEVRLFNYDNESAKEEGDFRLTLQDLENSLVLGPQILAVDYDLAVDMTPQFSGSTTWRSLLPKFDGNAVELGSLPDETFGGLVYGLSLGEVEGYLGNYLTMLPVGRAPSFLSGNALGITFTTLSGHNYVLEASTNLLDWQMATNFTATDTDSTFVDMPNAGTSKRFYRLRDDTGFMAFSGVVLDQTTGLPIAAAQIYSDWDGTSTYTDANGQFYLRTSLPSSWGEDELTISATGYGTVNSYYGGIGLVSGLQIYLAVPPPNDNFANRTVLTGSNISTNGNNSAASWESGEPYDTYYYSGYGNKSVWFSWTAPTTGSYLVSVSTPSVYYPILAIYTGTQLSSLSKVTDTVPGGYHASYTLGSVAGQTYQIEIDDYYGNGGSYTLSIAP